MPRQFFLLLAGAFCALAAPAAAAPTMVFASGQGADAAGCGAPGSPCRTLQRAVTNAPAGAYVLLQGSSDFGRAVIDKSLSIVGEGGATVSGAGAPARDAVILVNAGANDVVRLRGLTILNAPAGGAGVMWLAGRSVDIEACRILQTSGVGLQAMTTEGGRLVIRNSDIEAPYGVWAGAMNSPIHSYFDNLRVSKSDIGVYVGWSSAQNSKTVLVNSSVSNASNAGLIGYSGDFFVRNATVSGGQKGVSLLGGGIVHLSRSTISGNAVAIDAPTGDGGMYTFGDNAIRGNADDTLCRTLPANYR